MTSILLLHPKSAEDTALAAMKKLVEGFVGGSATVVLSRDDFNGYFKYDGSWDAWTRGAVRRHNGFVIVGDGKVGRATAGIVVEALRQGKGVAWVKPDQTYSRVATVAKTTGNLQDGWQLG